MLPNPVMTASGTAGHGAELAAYFDLSRLGAVVVKSLSAEPWAGNPAPRVHETDAGMLNSVGLQNPGVEAWLADELPALVATGARVVASIWGDDRGRLREGGRGPGVGGAGGGGGGGGQPELPQPGGRAPHVRHRPVRHPGRGLGGGRRLRRGRCGPSSAPTSPTSSRSRPRPGDGGAAALTLVNTVKGMAIDPCSRRPRLGAGGGGLSGAAIRPVAVRAVYDVHQAFPDLPLVGVGGVATGEHAVELLLAGASAVQVGTATFEDPRAVRPGARRVWRRGAGATGWPGSPIW